MYKRKGMRRSRGSPGSAPERAPSRCRRVRRRRLFWVLPIIGALLAGLAYHALAGEDKPDITGDRASATPSKN